MQTRHTHRLVGSQKLKALVLTQKHLITFYLNGRIEWLNKFYE